MGYNLINKNPIPEQARDKIGWMGYNLINKNPIPEQDWLDGIQPNKQKSHSRTSQGQDWLDGIQPNKQKSHARTRLVRWDTT